VGVVIEFFGGWIQISDQHQSVLGEKPTKVQLHRANQLDIPINIICVIKESELQLFYLPVVGACASKQEIVQHPFCVSVLMHFFFFFFFVSSNE
jgi:hypothetical protein